MVGPAVKREAVAHLQARLGLSERQACRNGGPVAWSGRIAR